MPDPDNFFLGFYFFFVLQEKIHLFTREIVYFYSFFFFTDDGVLSFNPNRQTGGTNIVSGSDRRLNFCPCRARGMRLAL